ncbi:TylF/MycF/NovP-related O-methyltransferase [Shimia aestuarii]|uniref:Macrocin-O-methyltransferase (TylF) n=1 Tax=Shimia aestuarii TaxID=254406 RepID=A0A1I4IA94_9RHOB|nr:TylF/MycF/NovP-related O-methyltransferase [Shimia aestuarii]SFL51298.1 Macrocin-O-methyltransferase (TylF) [Shimia aestuarii]
MFYGNFEGENKARFQEALKTLGELCGPMFAGDNLIGLQRAAGFREDKRFLDALRRNAESNQDLSIAWRIHTLVWAARRALHLPGDFVECGVWKGFSSSVIADYLAFETVDKQLYLYDTFSGIPSELNSENRSNEIYEKETGNDPDALYKHVIRRFSRYPNVRVVRGIVPDTFKTECPDQISLLLIDMNSAASEIAALDALFDKVVSGGLIIFDDYGWTGYAAQRHAENAFMEARQHSILEIPTGQGLVIKQ